MTEKIIETINNFRMIKGGERVLAGLSGGADSVCLVTALNEIKDRLGITLEAVHVNHSIRGKEALRDEEFCKSLCEKLGIKLYVRREDVPKIAKDMKKSVEEAARLVRYSIFSRLSSENTLIATAHTASDNGETVLLNLARGTGIKGMCGIPPVRGNIIRPLIDVTRQEVEDYLLKKGQDYVTDSTNFDENYTRNRIRHKIIPEILKINSGFYKTFCAELKIFSEENNFIEKNVKTAYNICNDKGALVGLKQYDPVIRKRCIARFLKEHNLEVSFDRINSIDHIVEWGGKINISGDIFAVCRKSVLTIIRNSRDMPRGIPLKEGENSLFENRVLRATTENDGKGIIDMEKVFGKILLRSRLPGDKIRLAGRDFTSKVKKLINENIRVDERAKIHFLADEEGLIYVEGFGAADRVKTDENTKKSLHVEIKDVKNGK